MVGVHILAYTFVDILTYPAQLPPIRTFTFECFGHILCFFHYSSHVQEKHGPSEFDDVLGDDDEGCDVGQFGKRRHSISKAQCTRGDHYDSDVPTVPLFVEMQGPGKFVQLCKCDVLW